MLFSSFLFKQAIKKEKQNFSLWKFITRLPGRIHNDGVRDRSSSTSTDYLRRYRLFFEITKRSQCGTFTPVYFVMAAEAYLSSKFELMCAECWNPFRLGVVKVITTNQDKGRHLKWPVESKSVINRIVWSTAKSVLASHNWFRNCIYLWTKHKLSCW